MGNWSITQARANIADVFDAALRDGPQRIGRRDGEGVVVLAEADFQRLTAAFPTFADFILNAPIDPDDLAERLPSRVLNRSGDDD